MRAPKAFFRLSLSTAFIAMAVAALLRAEGIWSFGRSLAEVSPTDRAAMVRARRELLEKMTPGAVSTWKDDTTGHLGEAHLIRVYEMHGMTCVDVEHILKLPETRRFRIPLCQADDGNWRAAF